MNRSAYILTFFLLGSFAEPAQAGIVSTSRLRNALGWAQKHPKLLVGGAVAIVGVVGITAWLLKELKNRRSIESYFRAAKFHNEGNFIEAVKEYEKSAQGGRGLALRELGVIYAEGHPGVPQNLEKAVEFFERAAKQDYDVQRELIGCYFELGRRYEEGDEGVTKDFSKAREFYEKAAKQGHKRALNKLVRLAESADAL